MIHCLGGDVVIAAATYTVTALALREGRWMDMRPWHGAAITIALGVLVTALSEWHNVYRVGSWSYAESMPLVVGIGVSPLLQWLILPP